MRPLSSTRALRRWSALAVAAGVVLAATAGCGNTLEKGYGYSCPGPLQAHGVLYHAVEAGSGLRIGSAIGSWRSLECVDGDAGSVAVSALVGVDPAVAVTGVADERRWIYAADEVPAAVYCAIAGARCADTPAPPP